MRIGITGGSGFVGRALVRRLATNGHELRCLKRETSDISSLEDLDGQVEWVTGGIDDPSVHQELVTGCDAVVHSAFWRPGKGFRGTEGDLVEFARVNILGSLGLMNSAIESGVGRFVFVSTCAVHEKILDDRPLDESHPLWPQTHYGAHKAAIEKFVHSYGLGTGYPICAIRPTGIYGKHRLVEDSKWFELVKDVVDGKDVEVQGGGKEVHVDDVAKGIEVLLAADGSKITGESFACYDRYISRYEVAQIAKSLVSSPSRIAGEPKSPKHEIVTDKIRSLGMSFGGEARLRDTVAELVTAIQNSA